MGKVYIDSKDSLFFELGGYDALENTSLHLLKRVISDDSINDLFIDTDIQTLISEFNALLACILDAPMHKNKDSLKIDNHKFVKRKIDVSIYNNLYKHLESTLYELNYNSVLVRSIIQNFEHYRHDLITGYRKVILVGLLKINSY